MDAYHDDLAYIHDSGFGRYSRNAAPVLLSALRERELHNGLVVDLGCGSGILSGELSSAGYDVLGIDLSASLLAIARKRAPQADFREGSLLSQEIPACVAVAGIGECLNYLFDAGNTPEALNGLFRRIESALCRGGVLLFDVAGPGRVPTPGLVRTHAEGPDWAVLVTAEEENGQRLLTRRITTFRKVGEFYRRGHEVHRLRLFPPAEIAEQLRGLGLLVETLDGYGDLRFPPGYVGFLASKP
jgi:SAM-dependent methyltransferase